MYIDKSISIVNRLDGKSLTLDYNNKHYNMEKSLTLDYIISTIARKTT